MPPTLKESRKRQLSSNIYWLPRVLPITDYNNSPLKDFDFSWRSMFQFGCRIHLWAVCGLGFMVSLTDPCNSDSNSHFLWRAERAPGGLKCCDILGSWGWHSVVSLSNINTWSLCLLDLQVQHLSMLCSQTREVVQRRIIEHGKPSHQLWSEISFRCRKLNLPWGTEGFYHLSVKDKTRSSHFKLKLEMSRLKKKGRQMFMNCKELE